MFTKTHIAALLASLLLAGTSFAQPAPDYSPDGAGDGYQNDAGSHQEAVDPPSRVARLALINGAVSFVPAGESDWTEAQINRPLISGDKLWTDRGARAELQIGASAIRVDEQSSFDFLNLDDNIAQVELTQGTLNLRVRRLYDGQSYEVDTPTLAFVINRVGEYRIDVAPDGHGTIVTAFHGGGDAYGEAGARFRIEEGQSIRFNDAQLRDYVSNGVPSPDDFDRFCFERDARWDRSPSRQFVAEDVIGYDDLDSNGSWSSDTDYGQVWYPSTVAAGWTPYSYGHWGWVGSYGWTWIDASPWGFAPFHYGRWAYIRNRWGWCPGPVHVRPYYAPALVAFIGGGGPRFGFAAGAPVGWFPLGPRDVYVPGYRVSRDYFSRVNIYNTRIDNVTVNNFYGNYSRGNFDYNRVGYANRNIAGAVTAVPGNVFVGARPIRGSALAVNRETFANARVSGFAAIAPTRESLALRGRAAIVPPQSVVNRNIIAATRPPAPMASFAQREAALQRDPGRALPARELRSGPTVVGNGEQAQRAERAFRPNVNVVTTNGQPARGAAPALGARDNAANAPIRPDRNAPNVQAGQRDASAPAQNGVERTFNPNARPAPVTAPQERVQSSRYAHPVDGGPAQTRQGPDLRDGAREYRSAPVERQAQPQFQPREQAQQPAQERSQPYEQERVQRSQPAQDRAARQPQFEQQRGVPDQQVPERAARQQPFEQQRGQQDQQVQERALRQQQFEQQRVQQQQQVQERAARQQQFEQQRVQQQQPVQERAVQQQRVQQQEFQQRAQPQPQQRSAPQEQQQPRARVRDDKDERGHR
jgi:hypothetical protein